MVDSLKNMKFPPLLLVNPTAGAGIKNESFAHIVEAFLKIDPELHIIDCKNWTFKNLKAQKNWMIGVVGGDGTVHDLINAALKQPYFDHIIWVVFGGCLLRCPYRL